MLVSAARRNDLNRPRRIARSFKRRLQTANHFGSGFEERLCFRLIYFVNVAAQMFDQFPKFLPNIRGMRPRIF